MAINSLSFRGTGAESAGSIAKAQKPVECPTCGQVSFKADSFEYSGKPKKKNTGLKVVLGTLGAAALAVVGLGCARKYGGNKKWLNWANNGENFLGKTAEKCEKLYNKVLEKGKAAIEWIKDRLPKRKGPKD